MELEVGIPLSTCISRTVVGLVRARPHDRCVQKSDLFLSFLFYYQLDLLLDAIEVLQEAMK